MAEKCEWFRVDCQVKEGVKNVVTDGLAGIARSWLDAASGLIEFVGGWWLKAPAISADSQAVFNIQESLWWYTGAMGILGILIALGRMVLSQDFKTLTSAAKPIVNIILVTGTYTAGITGLSKAGDELAKWIMDRAANTDSKSEGLDALGAAIAITSSNPHGVVQMVGLLLIIGLIALVGSIVLFGFMIFRDVTLLVMLAFMPSIAASTGSETGDQAFRKANGWLLSLLLFKPVAATIFALGVTLMKDSSGLNGDDGAVMKALFGVVVIVLASLSLPALVKFVVPAAAAGSSGFSGGDAIGGAVTVAAGAAVVSGAGAAAGGGASAAKGASTAAGGGSVASGAGAGSGATSSSTTAGGGQAAESSQSADAGSGATNSSTAAGGGQAAESSQSADAGSGATTNTNSDSSQPSTTTTPNQPAGETRADGAQAAPAGANSASTTGTVPSGQSVGASGGTSAGNTATQLPNVIPNTSRLNESIEGDDGNEH
jgi:type IV secretion system protein TrbL